MNLPWLQTQQTDSYVQIKWDHKQSYTRDFSIQTMILVAVVTVVSLRQLQLQYIVVVEASTTTTENHDSQQQKTNEEEKKNWILSIQTTRNACHRYIYLKYLIGLNKSEASFGKIHGHLV